MVVKLSNSNGYYSFINFGRYCKGKTNESRGIDVVGFGAGTGF